MHASLKDILGLYRHWRLPGTFVAWMLSAPVRMIAANNTPASEPTTIGDLVSEAKVRAVPILHQIAESDRARIGLIVGGLLILLILLVVVIRRTKKRKRQAVG